VALGSVEQFIQSNDGRARYQDVGAAVQLAGVCIYDGIAVHASPPLSSSHTEPFLVTPAAWKHNICGARITARGGTTLPPAAAVLISANAVETGVSFVPLPPFVTPLKNVASRAI